MLLALQATVLSKWICFYTKYYEVPPVGAFRKSNALRAFICTNAALSDVKILDFYVQRWNIEVFFRDAKSKLALDKYQIRSKQGIKRFCIIASLAHLIACFKSETFDFRKVIKPYLTKSAASK